MEEKEINTPSDIIEDNKSLSLSSIFLNSNCSNLFIEIYSKDQQRLNLIFRKSDYVNTEKQIRIEKLNELKEVKLLFDFECLSQELNLEKVKKLVYDFYNNINYKNKTKLSLSIENCVINTFTNIVIPDNKLILHELIISDELYNISPNLNIIFPEIEVNKLTLKKFKINSKLQLTNFCKFIINSDCKELTLEDIFIELLIKKDQDDNEYNHLDCYFEHINGVITLNNQYTYIQSLKLRDCPLFAFSSNMFKLNEDLEPKYIDIDETSLINPSIITKFKIKGKQFDICFDLDSYKLKKEQDQEEEKENKNENEEEDYLDHLTYIFNIIIGFSDEKKNKNNIMDEDENEENEDEEDEDKIGSIDRQYFNKLTFKNFDTTKYEYITNDLFTNIQEEDWILNDEEKERKKKWEDFEEKLKKFKFEKLPQAKSIIFDNCSNFFIKWILHFVKGNKNENVNPGKNNEVDFELLKFKKCGRDYVDLKEILTMKIRNLILFDTPVIIDHFNIEKKPHLDYVKDNLGRIENLTIKINTLDYYNKEYNLNIFKTMEIITELIQCSKFNKNLAFDMKALSSIMTFLVYKNYYSKKDIYYQSTVQENGEYLMKKEEIEKLNKENEDNDNSKELTCVPKQFFFSLKKYRDYAINNVFKLNSVEGARITVANEVIKKQTENYENLNYLLVKSNKHDKNSNLNNEIKKVDFGQNMINIDKDFKLFFSINNINTVTLKGITFTRASNTSVLKKEEGQTIINLMSFNEEEKKSLEENKYSKPIIPNYIIDVKTLNGLLFKNYLFEDIGSLFRYLMLKIEISEDNNVKDISTESCEKKYLLMDYFRNYQRMFNCFEEYIKELVFIINNVRELKEFYCILSIYKVILDKKNWIKEKVIVNKNQKDIELPNKKIIEREIGPYFLKDINEEEKEVYSEFNYYYSSLGEIKMLENKKFEINGYKYYFECQFNHQI